MIPDHLVAGVRAGDHAAISEVYALTRSELVDYVARRTRDRWLAEDLISEVFVKLCRSHAALWGTDGPQLHRWLYQTALRTVIAHGRSRAARVELEPLDDELGGGQDPADVVEVLERVREVAGVFAELTPGQARVMRLRAVGFTHPEIAERVGAPSMLAVKQMCWRARRRLAA